MKELKKVHLTISLLIITALTMVSCSTTSKSNSERDPAGSKCQTSHMTGPSTYFEDYEDCKKI